MTTASVLAEPPPLASATGGATPVGTTPIGPVHATSPTAAAVRAEAAEAVPVTGRPVPGPMTVVIVTHNSAGVVGGCLESIAAGLVGLDRHEVIVADNASTDDTVALIESRFPHVQVLRLGDNRGYAAGINAAIAARSTPGDVLILNPDVRLEVGFAQRLQAELVDDRIGIVAPRILSGSGGLERSLRRDPTLLRALGEALLGGERAGSFHPLGELVVDPDAYATNRDIDWATGAVLLVSRRCLDAVGPWDESFFLYSEETDFSLRARDRGFTIRYTPRATAVHLGGEAHGRPDLWALLSVNRVRLYRRRHGKGAARAFHLCVLLNELLRALRSPTHRAAAAALVRAGRSGTTGVPRPEPKQQTEAGWVCFSAQDWWYHNRAHSDFQLMRGVATTRKVLLVNSIGLRMPLPGRSTTPVRRILDKARSTAKLVRRPVPGLPDYHVMTPVMLPLYGNARGRQFNAWLVRTQVSAVSRFLGIREPVCMVTIPTAWDAVRKMKIGALIYNRSDKHSEFKESDQDVIAGLERELLRSADKVLYVSHELMRSERHVTGDRAYFLDHGVDLDLFRHRDTDEEPADLAAIPHPRVGYFGGLNDYQIDFDLFEDLARELPDVQLVLIGRGDEASLRRFDRYANVHVLGRRPYEEIPRYGSGFDVAVMPWLDNEWIRFANPIKLKEYLALRLPIVTTRFPEISAYESVVRVATRDNFVKLVRLSLTDGGPATPGARRAAVAEASWTRRSRDLVRQSELIFASQSPAPQSSAPPPVSLESAP